MTLPYWPEERLSELVERLGRQSGFAPEDPGSSSGLDIERIAARMGLHAELLELGYADVEAFLSSSAPALVATAQGWLGILMGGESPGLLAPDLSQPRLPKALLCAELRKTVEGRAGAQVDRVLARAGIRSESARRHLLGQRLGGAQFSADYLSEGMTPPRFFLLRPAAERLSQQLGEQRLGHRLAQLLILLLLSQLLAIGGWWVMGAGLLAGQVDAAWFWGWVLLMLCGLPLNLAISWVQGNLALGAGVLLKQRLLLGTLKLEPGRIRQAGVGQLIARVDESQAVEALALGAGFASLAAVVEVAGASWVLWNGAGGGLAMLALVGGCAVAGLLGTLYARQRLRWTDGRMSLSADILENMVGYRTRIAQLPPDAWHVQEDRLLDRYLGEARRLDRLGILLNGLFPGLWRILGLAALLPGLLMGASTGSLAVGLGGVLLAHGALLKLVGGLESAIGAGVAGRSILELVRAGGQREGVPAVEGRPEGALLEARNLVFAHPGQAPTLNGLNLRVERGDRILLEGASGAGKSTLGSILAGIRAPTSGLLLFGGLDRAALGSSRWRSRVVLTPQFHENHLVTETLAFNLLMGRPWPAPMETLAEATQLCVELGLGPLLERMPAGILQMVGEGGWKLSHGEQSRVMLARAILQEADVVVLDESFAALDPETMALCLETVVRRAPALVVIAHP